MKSSKIITALFITVVAVVLIGEAYVYVFADNKHTSDITFDNDGIDYSVSSTGSEIYSVLVFDNNDFGLYDKLYIYYDEKYPSNVEKVPVPVGAKAFTEKYYISQIMSMLNYRGIHDITILDADDLAKKMLSESKEKCNSGLIMLSGVMPDTIYRGHSDDLIFSWLNNGGRLYWAGNILGAWYSTSSDIVEVDADYQKLFFGTECLNTDSNDKAEDDIITNNYRYSLSLMNNDMRYGINAANLDPSTTLAVGYTDGTYSSIVLTKYGEGMLCVLGGAYSSNQRHDLAQVVSSGICYLTSAEPVGHDTGSIKINTVTGHIPINYSNDHNYVVYIYYGGYYPTYGKNLEIVR